VKDFEPHRIKFPHKKNFHTQCEALGTSVFSEYAKMLELQKVFPRFAKMKIAQGHIVQSDGKVLHGKNFHITWWVDQNDPHINFAVTL
jgi:hypothetical protein